MGGACRSVATCCTALLRDGGEDWQDLLYRFVTKARKYMAASCESYGEKIRCLVADDTDIAKTCRKELNPNWH